MKTKTVQTVFSFLHKENIPYNELRKILRNIDGGNRDAWVFFRRRDA